MNKGKQREVYIEPVGTVDAVVSSERAGIPHRVREDLCILHEEEVRIREGDLLEVVYRGNLRWWTVRLGEDDAMILGNILEPLSGPIDLSSSSSLEISDVEPLSYIRRPDRKLLTLVPRLSSDEFANLELPPSETVMDSSQITSLPDISTESIQEGDGICLLAPQVRALLNTTAKEETGLSYKKGDIIDVVFRTAADVWQGKLGSQNGTFRLDDSVEPIVKERVRALWDYTATTPNDLTFKSGEIIEVCGPSGASNWWLHGWMPKRGFGLFPYNFVESIEDEFPGDEEGDVPTSSVLPVTKSTARFRALHDVSAEEEGSLSFKRGDVIDLLERQSHEGWLGRLKSQTGIFRLDNRIEPIMTDRVMAIFSYESSNPEELSFSEGDCITVIGPSDDSTLWWYGTLNGRVGLFPYNYIDLVPDQQDSDSEDWTEAKVPQTVRALHNFSSKEPGILNFDVNDIITVIDANSGTEWWTGEANGRIGIFSRTYCEEVAEEGEEPLQNLSVTQKGDQSAEPDLFDPEGLNDLAKPTPDSDSSYSPELPSPKLSPIPEVASLAAESSKDVISASPGQMTPTEVPASPIFARYAPSSLPWTPCFARVLYGFKAKDVDELTVLRGDVVQVLSMMSADWWWGRLRDETGRVPACYLELIDLTSRPENLVAEEASYSQSPLASASQHPSTNGNRPLPLPNHLSQEPERNMDQREGSDKETLANAEWVRARHVWNSGKAGELVLQTGDIIKVLKRPYEHWWKGQLERNGHIGLFPANFVEVTASPPPRPKRRSSAFERDKAIIALRSNLARLHPLLRHFDTTRDLAESAQVQELFRSSVILRRKVLRLLGDKPDDEDLRRLDALFQEVKAHYDNVMQICANRAVVQDAIKSPNLPKKLASPDSLSHSNSLSRGYSESKKPPSYTSKQASTYSAPSRVSIRGVPAPLPPTPEPEASSSSEAWSSSLANMLNKRWSQGETASRKRYSGRLSAIEADIKRAKKGYQESVRSQEKTGFRRLPNPENPIAMISSMFNRKRPNQGTSGEPSSSRKTIHLPRVEYIHNHIMYANQQPVSKD